MKLKTRFLSLCLFPLLIFPMHVVAFNEQALMQITCPGVISGIRDNNLTRYLATYGTKSQAIKSLLIREKIPVTGEFGAGKYHLQNGQLTQRLDRIEKMECVYLEENTQQEAILTIFSGLQAPFISGHTVPDDSHWQCYPDGDMPCRIKAGFHIIYNNLEALCASGQSCRLGVLKLVEEFDGQESIKVEPGYFMTYSPRTEPHYYQLKICSSERCDYMKNISRICGIKELPITRYLEPIYLEITGHLSGEGDDHISCRINGQQQSPERLMQDFRWSASPQPLPVLSSHLYNIATMTHRQIKNMIRKGFK